MGTKQIKAISNNRYKPKLAISTEKAAHKNYKYLSGVV
jgi:hypothetical protein